MKVSPELNSKEKKKKKLRSKAFKRVLSGEIPSGQDQGSLSFTLQ